jgi:hypothetical protein
MGREDACLWSRPWLRYLATLVLGAKSHQPEGREGGGPRATAARARPPASQPASPAQPSISTDEMGTSADGQPQSQSQSQSPSQPDTTRQQRHRHTQTRTWTIRSQHTVAVRLPLGPLVRIIRLIACHEWSCAERAAYPGQTKPGHDPGPALLRCCVAALLRLAAGGRAYLFRLERERVPIHVPCHSSHVPCHSSHVPHPPVPCLRRCLTCPPAPCRAISSWICCRSGLSVSALPLAQSTA